jgi:hypothetical protein
MATAFLDRKGLMVVDAIIIMSQVPYRKLKKSGQDHSEQKAWNADI